MRRWMDSERSWKHLKLIQCHKTKISFCIVPFRTVTNLKTTKGIQFRTVTVETICRVFVRRCFCENLFCCSYEVFLRRPFLKIFMLQAQTTNREITGNEHAAVWAVLSEINFASKVSAVEDRMASTHTTTIAVRYVVNDRVRCFSGLQMA